MRRVAIAFLVMMCGACRPAATPGQYLYVWAGDSAATSSDFLAVVDADPASPHYGAVVGSLPTGTAGSHPHHTEAAMPANGHLLANGFGAGKTWLFDLTQPRAPKILASFGDLAGFSHPHTYVRLRNGNVLTTFQYRADSAAPAMSHEHGGMSMGGQHTTGGLVEMDERGTVIRSGAAADTTIADRHIFPYSVVEMPSGDRLVSTTTNMDEADTAAKGPWIQVWRQSDLTLLRSIALPPGPKGTEQQYTGEPLLLPDGSVYIHTFGCGLYLVRGVLTAQPTATFVHGFQGFGCGVPVLAGHYWLQPVPDAHALVALDVSDPEHPRQVSSLSLGDDEKPHWLAIDATGRRLVISSSDRGSRIYLVNFDPATGALAMDDRFRDSSGTRAGINLRGRTWPHGFTGTAVPHGIVFSR